MPGPCELPLVGHLFQLKVTQIHKLLEHWADTFGPLYALRLGRQPAVTMAAPDFIQAVLRHRPDTYRRLGAITRVLENMGGTACLRPEACPGTAHVFFCRRR